MAYGYKASVTLWVDDGPLKDPATYFEQALYYGEKHQDFTLSIDGDVVPVEDE